MNLLIKLIFLCYIINLYYVNVFCDNKFDYCKLEDGKDCRNHVACENTIFVNTNLLTNNLTFLNLTSFTNVHKTEFIKILNTIKNDFAVGNFKFAEKAANLDVIVWNDDLEKFAKVAAEKSFPPYYAQSLYCYNTQRLKHTFDVIIEKEYGISPVQFLKKVEEQFSKENRLKNQHNIDNILFAYSLVPITHIGCQFVSTEDDFEINTSVRCVAHRQDYMEGYTKGTPCSQCKTGCDSIYKGLCKNLNKF